jgi:ankyrin repeat protein
MSKTLKQRQKVTKRKHRKDGKRTKKLGGGLYCNIKDNTCYDRLSKVIADVIQIYDKEYDTILNKLIKQSVSKRVTAKQLVYDGFSLTNFSRSEASSLAQTLQKGFLDKVVRTKYNKSVDHVTQSDLKTPPLMSTQYTPLVKLDKPKPVTNLNLHPQTNSSKVPYEYGEDDERQEFRPNQVWEQQQQLNSIKAFFNDQTKTFEEKQEFLKTFDNSVINKKNENGISPLMELFKRTELIDFVQKSTPSGNVTDEIIENEKIEIEIILSINKTPYNYIDSRDVFGYTALNLAAWSNKTHIVKKLLEKHALHNTANTHGEIPLMGAIQWGNVEIAQMLIDKGEHVGYITRDGESMLMYAARFCNKKMIDFIMKNMTENDKNLPVNKNAVKLIKQKCTNQMSSFTGFKELESIGEEKKCDSIDVNLRDIVVNDDNDFNVKSELFKKEKNTDCEEDAAKKMKKLEDMHKTFIAAKDYEKHLLNSRNTIVGPLTKTQLESAAARIANEDMYPEDFEHLQRKNEREEREELNSKKNVYKYLNADEFIDENGNTKLMREIKNRRLDYVKILIDNDGSITDIKAYYNQQNKDGYNALMIALEMGLDEIALLLIDKTTTDVNAQNKDGETALILAAIIGNPKIAKLLIEKGADVNKPDFIGRTPLMMAANSCHLEMVYFLIQNGANVDLKTKYFGAHYKDSHRIGWDIRHEKNADALKYATKISPLMKNEQTRKSDCEEIADVLTFLKNRSGSKNENLPMRPKTNYIEHENFKEYYIDSDAINAITEFINNMVKGVEPTNGYFIGLDNLRTFISTSHYDSDIASLKVQGHSIFRTGRDLKGKEYVEYLRIIPERLKLVSIGNDVPHANTAYRNSDSKNFKSPWHFIRFILGIQNTAGDIRGGKKTRKQPRNKKPNAGRRTRSNKK